MERRPGHLVAVLGCLLHLVCTAAAISENVDTLQPILRTSPPADETTNGYFGYSLVLHQVSEVNPGDSMSAALDRSRIIVSAPRATISGSSVSRTGAVYECPVNPGACSGLEGDGNGADNRLYDTQDNVPNEDKREQFLGGSMFSNEDGFIACAHRYTETSGDFITPIGRCYYTTNRQLRDFQTIDPCPLSDRFSLGGGGICQVGTSSVITRDNQGEYTLGLGAPGYFRWRGLVIRRDPDGDFRRQSFGQGTQLYSYQGYAITSGFFVTLNREDYAVSVPKRDNYFGSVNIVTNSDSLSVVNQPELRGQQMGEYYGFSVLSANLNGDDFSELLVGAPMYRASTTQPETGRVFIYSNVQGSLRFLRFIEGFEAFSRFGYAMANMGDINGDGYDDIAIGAPFTGFGGTGSGTVYIYHSSRQQTLTMTFQQRIVGSDLSLSLSLSGLRGFGSALASGVDVDANSYNDLAIGSFMSQQVFLLRTRPLAMSQLSLTAYPRIINLDDMCPFDGSNRACISINACITYSGTGVSNTLNLELTVNADVTNIERRLEFSNGMTSSTVPVTATSGEIECSNQTVFVRDNTVDRLNPFVFSMSVQANSLSISPGDGNQAPVDFSMNPVISATGASTVQVETFRNCGGDECVPDLRLNIVEYNANLGNGNTERSNEIILGSTRSVEIEADVNNMGEDAFQTTVTISVPTRNLAVGRVFGSLNSGNRLSLSCPTSEDNGEGMTLVTCNIANPLMGEASVRLTITVMPTSSLIGNEGDINVGLRVDSVNPGPMENTMDTGMISIRAQADVTLDSMGLVNPELVTYSNMVPDEPIVNATQFGPPVVASFLVRNTGPSTIGTVSLVIDWPLRASNDEENYVIYPALIGTAGTGATVTCMNTNINPDMLGLSDIQDSGEEEGQGTGSLGGKKRKRRRRGAVYVPDIRQRRLTKRQDRADDDKVDVVDPTVNITYNCSDPDSPLMCVPIECTIIGLQGGRGDQARVDITAFIDNRYFANSNDRFFISPTARVSIENGEFIDQLNPDGGKTASARIPIFPASVSLEPERTQVPWWVIFLAILAAVIILAVIVGVLWGLGFFRRRKHEELKQKREDLQNLANNGAGPGAELGPDAGSKDDIIKDGTNL